MTPDQLREHLQENYFDNVDGARPEQAVQAFTTDVRWQHTQVWQHDGHDARTTDRLVGRQALCDFLQARVPEMQVIAIRHEVNAVIVNGDCGAFRAAVVGPSGRRVGFLGWVQLEDRLISDYLVVPESFSVKEQP